MSDGQDVAPITAASPKGGKKSMMLIGIILAVTALEGVGFFFLMKMFYATPKPAYGENSEAGEHAIPEEHPEQVGPTRSAEVKLVERFKVPNSAKGISFLYDFDIAILVPEAEKEAALLLVAASEAQIRDRVSQLVRAASARVLEEVDFKTLRMQIQEALGEIFHNDHLVIQVLSPRCVPIRAG